MSARRRPSHSAARLMMNLRNFIVFCDIYYWLPRMATLFSDAGLVALGHQESKSPPITRFSPLISLWIAGSPCRSPRRPRRPSRRRAPSARAWFLGQDALWAATSGRGDRLRSVVPRGSRRQRGSVRRHRRLRAVLRRRQRRAAGAMDCVRSWEAALRTVFAAALDRGCCCRYWRPHAVSRRSCGGVLSLLLVLLAC